MPPKRSTVAATAASTWDSSRMSPTIGRARPPAASISAAAVKTVPRSFGCGSAGLGDQRDVGAVAGDPQGDLQADAAAAAGYEQGLVPDVMCRSPALSVL